MNPIVAGLISTIIDRALGSKKAKITTAAGAGIVATTATTNIGAMISPEYAEIINAFLYFVGLISIAYREKEKS